MSHEAPDRGRAPLLSGETVQTGILSFSLTAEVFYVAGGLLMLPAETWWSHFNEPGSGLSFFEFSLSPLLYLFLKSRDAFLKDPSA